MADVVQTADSVAEVAQWLRSRPGPVRVRGSGSRQASLPAAATATQLDLSRLTTIVRLDPGDQTCTVQCGVHRRELDAALAEHALELPCLGGGTIAGLFASDPTGPAAAGAQSPRSLLLGLSATLADGTTFRAGARVVKSVAGFDVHKLLVGSNGRLFVATELHLRLKPRPRAEQWFRNARLDRAEALGLLDQLRRLATPPAVLQLRRERDGSSTVLGRVVGRDNHVAATVRTHGLQSTEPIDGPTIVPVADEEVVRGIALPSRLPQLLEQLPAKAPFGWLGGGRFETALASTAGTDALLTSLSQLGCAAAIVHGAPRRRGHGTTIDPGQQRLAAGLKQALDPDGILV